MEEVTFEGREALNGTLYGNAKADLGVVLCPPHPLYGGNRHDIRLSLISEDLAMKGISALCFDYGSYSSGIGEVKDALSALSFLRKRVKSVGIIGYSFGALVASNVASKDDVVGFVFLSTLRRLDRLEVKVDFDAPKLFVHGIYDDIAPYSDFKELYARAREMKEKMTIDTDHFYLDNPRVLDVISRRILAFFGKFLIR